MERKEKFGKVDWPVLALTAAFLLVSGAYGWRILRGGESGSYRIEVESGQALAQEAPERVLIDVNTATAEELDRLTGIGPALAQAIVDEREANGPFASLDELLRVRGIGEAKLEGLRGEAVAGGEDGQ